MTECSACKLTGRELTPNRSEEENRRWAMENGLCPIGIMCYAVVSSEVGGADWTRVVDMMEENERD